MAVTVGELKGYWKKVADAVSSNKMNVTDADILAALMAIGQTIEDVEAEIQAIKSTEGIKKIADTVDVQLTGSKSVFTTILNAVTVAPGANTAVTSMGLDGTEEEVWVFVQIDQQPWTLRAEVSGAIDFPTTAWYPIRKDATTTHPAGAPAASLYLGQRVDTHTGLSELSNMSDAKSHKVPPVAGKRLYVTNGSANVATVTVKIMRVLR